MPEFGGGGSVVASIIMTIFWLGLVWCSRWPGAKFGLLERVGRGPVGSDGFFPLPVSVSEMALASIYLSIRLFRYR